MIFKDNPEKSCQSCRKLRNAFWNMKICYFAETDTLYVQFNEKEVVETQELNKNTLLDLDAEGNLVAITLEHARETANIFDFSFQQAAMPMFQDV